MRNDDNNKFNLYQQKQSKKMPWLRNEHVTPVAQNLTSNSIFELEESFVKFYVQRVNKQTNIFEIENLKNLSQSCTYDLPSGLPLSLPKVARHGYRRDYLIITHSQ